MPSALPHDPVLARVGEQTQIAKLTEDLREKGAELLRARSDLQAAYDVLEERRSMIDSLKASEARADEQVTRLHNEVVRLRLEASQQSSQSSASPSAAPLEEMMGTASDSLNIDFIAETQTQAVLSRILQGLSLPSGGSKRVQATRIVERARVTPALQSRRLPSRLQLVYMAAVARRQQLTPSLEDLVDRDAAMRWLTAHGDRSN